MKYLDSSYVICADIITLLTKESRMTMVHIQVNDSSSTIAYKSQKPEAHNSLYLSHVQGLLPEPILLKMIIVQ